MKGRSTRQGSPPDAPSAERQATSSEIVFYQAEDGLSRIEVRLEEQSVWLSQRLIAEVYQVSVPTVNEHLSHVYEEGELEPGPTVRKFRIVQLERAEPRMSWRHPAPAAVRRARLLGGASRRVAMQRGNR